MTVELEPLWSDIRIYNRLMEDAFVYREVNGIAVANVLFVEHALRAMGNMQNAYLYSLRDREYAWQQEVSSRDRKIAELSVECTLLNKRIAELEAEKQKAIDDAIAEHDRMQKSKGA
jgi:hypothetical protein